MALLAGELGVGIVLGNRGRELFGLAFGHPDQVLVHPMKDARALIRQLERVVLEVVDDTVADSELEVGDHLGSDRGRTLDGDPQRLLLTQVVDHQIDVRFAHLDARPLNT